MNQNSPYMKALAQNETILQSTIETMYRVSADDYTREEIRAREDELRVQRTIESQLIKRAKLIAEHEVTIANQESTIAEQNKRLAELEAQIESLKAQMK